MTKELLLHPPVFCKTLKTKTAAAVLAAAGAVALPQVFHAAGALSGAGPAFGQAFLPMHLPVLLAGFLAGPVAGLAAGAAAPLISFLFSGMPAASMIFTSIIQGLPGLLLQWISIPVLLYLTGRKENGHD